MKPILFLIFVLFISCQSQTDKKNESSKPINSDPQLNNTKEEAVNNWINEFPENIKVIQDSFACVNIKSFNCSIIDEYYTDYDYKLDTKNLVQIDSVNSQKIFGNAVSDFGPFYSSYLYSIEKPFFGFYPITVIQYFGVVERPLMLIIFNSDGKYLNSIEVADSYGETGGCLSSKFVNDSTLIRKFKWDDYGIDSLGNDVWESSYRTEQVTFQRNGKYNIEEIKYRVGKGESHP